MELINKGESMFEVLSVNTITCSFAAYSPEILISIGDAIISKMIKKHLRKHPANEHWQISPNGVFRDTYNCLSHKINCDNTSFFSYVNIANGNSDSNYAKQWQMAFLSSKEKHKAYFENLEFSDLKVFDCIFKKLEANTDLHISNSSPIRYQQLFETKKINSFCNRGTSGIDGCSSTALGYSIKNDNETWFISGDVSFLYDSNAWWNNYRSNIKIIVINNGGGGIFRILPGPEKIDDFETFFETKHNVNIEMLCKAYSLDYVAAETIESLESGMEVLKSSKNAILLEIKTPSLSNAKQLRDYFSFIRSGD